jgi:hypothetical protein
MRQELAKELGEAIDEFGPQIWDDFDKVLLARSRQEWLILCFNSSAFLSHLQVFPHRPVNKAYGGERAELAPSMRKVTCYRTRWYVLVVFAR